MKTVLVLTLSLLVTIPSSISQQTNPTQGLPDSPRPDSDGVFRVGNGVSAPVPLVMHDPEFSEKARKKKIRGNCRVSHIVKTDGSVSDVKVIRSAEGQPPKLRAAAESLDEKAVEAVQQYRFKPGLREGKPVPIAMTIEVNFQIF